MSLLEFVTSMKSARLLELATKNNILAVLSQFPSWLTLIGGVMHIENLLQPVF